MFKDAYTTQEMCVFLGVKKKALLHRAHSGGWDSRPRAGRGGGFEWVINDKMPSDTRAAIAAALVAAMPGKVPALGDADVVIPDWAFEMGRARARIVMEWRAFVASARNKGTPKMLATNDFFMLLEAGQIVSEKVLKTIGKCSIKTIYKWDKLLRESGDNLEVLADRRGKWLQGGAKGLGQIGPEAESIVLAEYLTPNKDSLAYVYERKLKPRLENKGLPVPSYDSVRRFMKRYEENNYDIVVFRRDGEKAYADHVGPYLSRNDKLLKVGDVLVSDGHRMNFMVINPETGKECRMTLIGWQDWASRMFVAFEIMLNENTQAISSSLHRAIVNLGKMPKTVYIDNGRAFKNKFFDGNPDLEEYDGLYMRLGIDPQHSAPYIARTKVIERWWKDFDQQCARALDSYIGASIAEKPAHLMRNEKWHKARREKLGQNYVPTVEDVVRILTEFAKWKAMQPHPTRKDTTPWEMFQAGRGHGFNEGELADMARHFMFRKQINPSRCRFTLYNIEYESEVLDVLHGLKKPLMAHYSYSNLAEVYLYDEGRYLGKARPVSTVNPLAAKFGTEMDLQQVKSKRYSGSNTKSGRKAAGRSGVCKRAWA